MLKPAAAGASCCGAGASCWGAAASCCGAIAACRGTVVSSCCCGTASLAWVAARGSSATSGVEVSCRDAVTSLGCAVSSAAAGEDRASVTGCSAAVSAEEGTSAASRAGRAATQGMPRRVRQFRSRLSQICCLQGCAAGAESSALARRGAAPAHRSDLRTRQPRWRSQNAGSNTRPVSWIGNLGPPVAQKQRRCGGTMSA